MTIAKEDVLKRLKDYLNHAISHKELVDWAENAMQEGAFSENNHDILRDIVARIGVSDVRAFGLTLEEYEEMIRQLGYSLHVEIVPA